MQHSVALRAVVCLALTTAGIIGCQPQQPIPKQQLAGTVTMDGEPVPEGMISLIGVDSDQRAVGKINEGEFTLRALQPLSGKFRVEVLGYRKTGRQVPTMGAPDGMDDEVEAIVPEKYNTKSKLIVEVADEPLELKLTTE